jgi:hypothetical protein
MTYNGIRNRSAIAALTRLRTGHCELNHYLYRFGLTDTPYCSCGRGKETVEHYLLECELYVEQKERAAQERWYRENESRETTWISEASQAYRGICSINKRPDYYVEQESRGIPNRYGTVGLI